MIPQKYRAILIAYAPFNEALKYMNNSSNNNKKREKKQKRDSNYREQTGGGGWLMGEIGDGD